MADWDEPAADVDPRFDGLTVEIADEPRAGPPVVNVVPFQRSAPPPPPARRAKKKGAHPAKRAAAVQRAEELAAEHAWDMEQIAVLGAMPATVHLGEVAAQVAMTMMWRVLTGDIPVRNASEAMKVVDASNRILIAERNLAAASPADKKSAEERRAELAELAERARGLVIDATIAES